MRYYFNRSRRQPKGLLGRGATEPNYRQLNERTSQHELT